MKKILSFILTVCLIFALSSAFTSCGHDCKFSDRQSDDDYHWYACEINDCEEINQKEEHEYEYVGFAKMPTQGSDGEKLYSCTVCKHIKTETVKFTGMTESQWNAAFASNVFLNFEYNEIAVIKRSGVTVDTSITYKFTEDNAWISMTAAGETQSSYAPNTASANQARNQIVNSIIAIADYSKYVYDYPTMTYKSTVPVEIAALDASTEDVTLTFAAGKLVKIEYTVDFVQESVNYTASEVITIAYGVVTLP